MPFHSFVWQRSRVWSRAQAKVGLARHSKFPRPLETLQNRESFRLDLIRSPLSPTSDDRTHYTLSRSPPAALPLIAPATTIILFCSLLVDSRLSTLDPRPVNPSNNHHQPPLGHPALRRHQTSCLQACLPASPLPPPAKPEIPEETDESTRDVLAGAVNGKMIRIHTCYVTSPSCLEANMGCQAALEWD